MKVDLDRLVPPGIEARKQLRSFLTCLVMSVFISTGWIIEYADSYWAMYRNDELVRAMPAFGTMIRGNYMIGFPVTVIAMLTYIIVYYVYYFTGSKSIYTMRRLGRPWELHKRCWTLPLLLSAAVLLVCVLLVGVYFLIYMLVTPVEGIWPVPYGSHWVYRDEMILCEDIWDVWYYQWILLWRG